VTEDHGHVLGLPPWHLEPGHQSLRRRCRAFLHRKIHRPVRLAEAQAGEGIDDAAQALVAGQVIAPAIGLVAVHVAQEVHPLVAAQHGFHLVGQRQGLLQVPLGQHAGMHDQLALFVDGQGAVAQPVDELVAVGGVEDIVEGVVAVRWADAAGHGQQVQVMVAQHRLGALAHLHHGAQGVKGLGAAVDEVAGEDQ